MMGSRDESKPRTLQIFPTFPFFFAVTLLILASTPGASGAKFTSTLDGSRPHRMRQTYRTSKTSSTTSGGQQASDYVKGNREVQHFFEVMRPVDIPQGAAELCSHVILQHTFGNTINDPPTLTHYTPLPSCQGDWTKVLLRWHATSRGRQFDRISAVWLSGVEVFRTCTAEPTNQGIVWVVEKDVTQFSSLFKQPQLLALELANVVDDTYTGLYNVTLSLHFYTGGKVDSTSESYGGSADAILPISEVSPLQGGYWFQLQNENDLHQRELQIPRNAYKAVIEICVSFHGDDEFWYTNPPNDFLVANNLTGAVAGNGTFREVLLSIDGLLAGVVYPFPVFYTGGVDPFFWRPVSAIGSFVVPSFHVDITPFLGRLVDGGNHSFTFTVTNALPYWLLGANLHLWLDRSRESTQGELFDHIAPALSLSTRERYHELDGTFATDGSRTLAFKGYLVSSFGNLTTSASYSFRFSNLLVLTEGSNASDVRQESKSESKVVVKSPVKDLVYDHSAYQFPLRLSYYQTNNPDGSVSINASIDHGWEQEQQSQSRVGAGRSSFNTLKNKQRSRGSSSSRPRVQSMVRPPQNKGLRTRARMAVTSVQLELQITHSCMTSPIHTVASPHR